LYFVNHNHKLITIPAPDESAFHIVFYNTNSIRKGKFHPVTGQEGPEVEQRYSSTVSSTSALHVVGGQHDTPATLLPWNSTQSHF